MTVSIRLATENDGTAIAAIYRPYVETSHVTFEEEPPSPMDVARRITASAIHPWLVLEADGAIAAYASTSPMRARHAYRWSVETGIYVGGSSQGCGFGRMLLGTHLDLLGGQGFVSAMVGIALPNDTSIALHEKLGFTLSGLERAVGYKLGQWVDVARYQRDLAQRPARPEEPRPFADVRHPGLEPGPAFTH